jgi:hypothetical protein
MEVQDCKRAHAGGGAGLGLDTGDWRLEDPRCRGAAVSEALLTARSSRRGRVDSQHAWPPSVIYYSIVGSSRTLTILHADCILRTAFPGG